MSTFRKCKIEVGNDFHNTTAAADAFFRAGSDAIYITRATAKRIKSVLCGISDCTCGDAIGARPSVAEDCGGKWIVVSCAPVCVFEGEYKFEYCDDTGRLIKK